MIRGFLVTLNGDCKKNLKGIYTVFIPVRDKSKAIECVEGNGDIIGCIPYEVDTQLLDDKEKALLLDRIAYAGEY